MDRSKWSRFHAGFHQFVFHEISKYVDVQQSGMKQHPFTFQRTGNEYCLTSLHHLSVKEYANIRQHLISGIFGTEYNDWSHVVPATLGCLLKVIGAGTGVAHVEIKKHCHWHLQVRLMELSSWLLVHCVFPNKFKCPLHESHVARERCHAVLSTAVTLGQMKDQLLENADSEGNLWCHSEECTDTYGPEKKTIFNQEDGHHHWWWLSTKWLRMFYQRRPHPFQVSIWFLT